MRPSRERFLQPPEARQEGGEMPKERGDGKKNQGILARVGEMLIGKGDEAAEDEKATTMLKEDHDRVRLLFKRYDELGERAHAEKQRIVNELSTELDIHAQLEEKIFYQACLSGEKETTKIIRESFEEHKIVKTLLAELDRVTPEDEQFDAKVTVLKEAVEHHAKEEEDDLFPQAEDLLGSDGLRRVGAEMKSFKEDLQERATIKGPGKAKRPTPQRAKARRRSKSSSKHSYA
jgi:Hemerythrin HHE cation binding domain